MPKFKIASYFIAFFLYVGGYYALCYSQVPKAETLWLAIVLYGAGQTVQNNAKD